MCGVRREKHNDRPAGAINQLWSRKPHHTRKHTATHTHCPFSFLLSSGFLALSILKLHLASWQPFCEYYWIASRKNIPKAQKWMPASFTVFSRLWLCWASIRSRGRSLPTAPSDSPVWLSQPPTLCQSFIARWNADQQTPVWWSALHQTGNYIPCFQLQFDRDRGETKHWAPTSLASAQGETTEMITAIFQLYDFRNCSWTARLPTSGQPINTNEVLLELTTLLFDCFTSKLLLPFMVKC